MWQGHSLLVRDVGEQHPIRSWLIQLTHPRRPIGSVEQRYQQVRRLIHECYYCRYGRRTLRRPCRRRYNSKRRRRRCHRGWGGYPGFSAVNVGEGRLRYRQLFICSILQLGCLAWLTYLRSIYGVLQLSKYSFLLPRSIPYRSLRSLFARSL